MNKFFLLCFFFLFSPWLTAKDCHKLTTIQNFSIGNNQSLVYTIKRGEPTFIIFNPKTSIFASFGDAITINEEDFSKININEPGDYMFSFSFEYISIPLDLPLYTQFYFTPKGGEPTNLGPISVKVFNDEIFPRDEAFVINYILSIETEGTIQVGIINDSKKDKELLYNSDTLTMTVLKLSDRKKPSKNFLPHLSALNKGGAVFNFTSFNTPQFFPFDFPDTLSNKDYIDFDCSNPREIILKAKGKYLVMFNSSAISNIPGAVLQFYLKGDGETFEPINSVTVETSSPAEQVPYLLQNIVNVTEENSKLMVGYSVLDRVPATGFREISLLPYTISVNVIYLSK